MSYKVKRTLEPEEQQGAIAVRDEATTRRKSR